MSFAQIQGQIDMAMEGNTLSSINNWHRGPPPSRKLQPKAAIESPGRKEVGRHTGGSPRGKYSQAAFPGKRLVMPDPVKQQCSHQAAAAAIQNSSSIGGDNNSVYA